MKSLNMTTGTLIFIIASSQMAFAGKMISLATKNCVGIAAGSEKAPEAPAVQLACTEGDDQNVTLSRYDDNSFDVKINQSQLCLDVVNGDETQVVQKECTGEPSQRFKLTSALKRLYIFQNVLTGKCLDVNPAEPTEGSPLVQWDCEGTKTQVFELPKAQL